MTDLPASLQPFVLPGAAPADQRVDRIGDLDLYRPASTARAGAILFVHGGPAPSDLAVPPRDWPVYQGMRRRSRSEAWSGSRWTTD